MNKSKLKTDFICIATSGYTVDGRQITAQELHEMADSYDPEYYTANLWPEHRRWFNMGQVVEVKAEENEKGETELFAVIAPNQELIEQNREGQYLFTSIEITPNFRNSGKAYLSGLGVTDSPASVGTTKLNFFNTKQKDSVFSDFIKVDFSIKEDIEEDKALRTLVNAFRKLFSHSAQIAEEKPNPKNNNNKEDYSMDQKQVDQIVAAVNGLGAKIDSHFSAQPQPTEPQEPEQPKDGETVSKEEFSKLQKEFNALSEKFNALNKEVTTVPNGEPAGNGAHEFKLTKGI